MAAQCKACSSRHVQEINVDLSKGAFISDTARKYGVPERSLARHRENHLPAFMVRASTEHAGPTLLEQVEALQVSVGSILAKAENDPKTQLLAIREARSNLELLAKLTGELRTGGGTVTTNNTLIVNNPQYLQLKTIVLEETLPFPDVRARIIKRLEAGGE